MVQEGNCSTCFGHYKKTYTREQILSQELLPPLHPNCKCSLEPADEGTSLPEEKPNTFQYNITHWDDEIKQLWDSFNQVQDDRKSNIHDFWSWLDYWSAGKVTRLKELKAKADSSYYIMDKIDLYTLGLIDDWARMIVGTFWPEKPGSVEHAIDSISTAAMAISSAKGLQSFATGGSAAGGTSGAARLLGEGFDATDDVIRKEVLYALDDVGDEIQRGAINAVDDVGDAARREIIEIPLEDKPITGSGIVDDVVKGGRDSSTIRTQIQELKSKTPKQLLDDGWQDITDFRMAANTTSKELYNPKTGLKIRFDQGVKGASGFEGVDHYHVYNNNYTNKKVDFYFDIDGNLVGKGSKASHIIVGGGD